LLKNLADALTKSLTGHRRKLNRINIAEFPNHQPSEPDAPNTSGSRQERYQAYQTAVELARQGVSQKAIAQHLNRHPRTIRRWLQAGTFPEICRSGRKSMLDTFKPHIIQRWQEGCWNATELYREIQTLGYQGGVTIVRDFVQRLRSKQGLSPKARSFTDGQLQKITPRQAAHIILMRPDDYDEELRQTLDHIRNLSQEVQQAVRLAQDFADMLRQRQGERFDAWLAKAEAGPT
jgi:transposase